jgi:Flp pilus assembly protein TadG
MPTEATSCAAQATLIVMETMNGDDQLVPECSLRCPGNFGLGAFMRHSSYNGVIPRRSRERGQTIILVAVSLVSLLAMAALAIDVVTLYVARSEMQRAADAAALAGAKAFVDSGYTSDPSPARQTLAQNMATAVIGSVVQQNRVAGVAPQQAPGSPNFTNLATTAGNPAVSVTLQRTDLPTFFSRIWGRRLSTVSATAVAEAYNPSNAPAGYPPITPKCVKPIMVVNVAPNQFIDPATFVPKPNLIGTQITLTPCGGGGCGTNTFRPALVDPASRKLCPECTAGNDYENGVQCCDTTTYACGSTVPPINVDIALTDPMLGHKTHQSLKCMINHPAEDTIDTTDLTAGTGPAHITAGSGPLSGSFVTTSRSIAALPVIDSPTANTVHVIGFLQVFVDSSTPAQVKANILNEVGCGNHLWWRQRDHRSFISGDCFQA